ncbi:MAG TPA: hypothetical protein VKX41_21625 [Alloacidobacterium sp.]|nr:hypothetical protein [Alloacidobacterium sp.]
MGMLDLNIDSLSLNITNAEGHEHRIRPIVTRAASIFAEKAEGYYAENPGPHSTKRLNSLSAEPVNVNLQAMTDEHAAQSIARAWLQALALKLI